MARRQQAITTIDHGVSSAAHRRHSPTPVFTTVCHHIAHFIITQQRPSGQRLQPSISAGARQKEAAYYTALPLAKASSIPPILPDEPRRA